MRGEEDLPERAEGFWSSSLGSAGSGDVEAGSVCASSGFLGSAAAAWSDIFSPFFFSTLSSASP